MKLFKKLLNRYKEYEEWRISKTIAWCLGYASYKLKENKNG